jgi:hypothetical protein
LAESLQTLTTLTRNNRKIFMSRLNKNGAQKVLTNAVALNDQRKAKAKAEENARLAEERKRKAAEEVKKKKEQNMKNVSRELQKLTNLTKSNRGSYIKRLNTMSKNTIITEAKSEDARRKREKEKKRLAQEDRNRQAKLKSNTAKMLQGMSGLERSNRKEFMNRIQRGNDPARVISNARARNQKARSRSKTGPQPRPAQQPQGRIAPRTKKIKAKKRGKSKKGLEFDRKMKNVLRRL